MSCENKLTNLVFKNKENSARTQCASFSFLPFFFVFNIQNKKKTPRMKCNATRRDKRKKKTQKPKNKEQWSQREKQ